MGPHHPQVRQAFRVDDDGDDDGDDDDDGEDNEGDSEDSDNYSDLFWKIPNNSLLQLGPHLQFQHHHVREQLQGDRSLEIGKLETIRSDNDFHNFYRVSESAEEESADGTGRCKLDQIVMIIKTS